LQREHRWTGCGVARRAPAWRGVARRGAAWRGVAPAWHAPAAVYDRRMGDPYREVPERALVVQRGRRPRRIHWAGLLAGAGASVALVAGAPIDAAAGFAFTIGALGYAAITLIRGRGARRAFASLPFPVEIAGDIGADSPRPIREVEIRFASAPGGLAGDQVAAAWSETGLAARLDGDVLQLTGWSWGSDDLAQLARLLEQIGRGQHTSHAIARVVVHRGSIPGPSL
jgi:hypothetical protein